MRRYGAVEETEWKAEALGRSEWGARVRLAKAAPSGGGWPAAARRCGAPGPASGGERTAGAPLQQGEAALGFSGRKVCVTILPSEAGASRGGCVGDK